MVLTGLARAVGLHALVTTRLRLVVGALKRIAEGDFTRRLRTDGGDDIASVMRTFDDLGDRLQSRSAALQSAERRCRLLYEHGPAGMFRTRLDGSVVDCNPAAARMLGFAGASEVKARNAASFYADPEERARLIERLRCHGVLADLPLTFRRQDGRRLPVRLTLMQTQEGVETYLDSVVVLDSLALEAGEERAADDRPVLALDVSLPGGVLVAS
jgi:PAS domain S-box-containing protein